MPLYHLFRIETNDTKKVQLGINFNSRQDAENYLKMGALMSPAPSYDEYRIVKIYYFE